MNPTTLFFVIVLFLQGTAFAEKPQKPNLDQLISKSDQKKMGLHKLTSHERELLRAYIVNLLLRFVQLENGSTGSVIESKIDGSFEGWDGETIVKLWNGQIWQQDEYYYTYHYSYMPKVLIYKSGGTYKMRVDGIDRAIRVERLK